MIYKCKKNNARDYISIALRPRVVQVTTSINNKVHFIVYYILELSINNRIPRMLETKCVIELLGILRHAFLYLYIYIHLYNVVYPLLTISKGIITPAIPF